jgi:hypothetical protein
MKKDQRAQKRPIRLAAETIRVLERGQFGQVAGGFSDPSQCIGTINSVCCQH